MAPKKSRIKKPGWVFLGEAGPKVLLRRVVQGQVKVLSKDTAVLYTPFHPLALLVMEITKSCTSQVIRWTPEALLFLQDAADFYLNETFDARLMVEEPVSIPCTSARETDKEASTVSMDQQGDLGASREPGDQTCA